MESLGSIILYVIVALSIIVFSILAVTTRRILRAATYLLFVLFGTAAVYFMIGYQFLGAMQIAVYAGGILVLFVFAILLTSKPCKQAEPLTAHRRHLGLLAGVAGVAACGFALVTFNRFCGLAMSEATPLDMEKIGTMLLGTGKYQYLLPFEAVSVLLLACIIGAIVVARRDKDNDKK